MTLKDSRSSSVCVTAASMVSLFYPDDASLGHMLPVAESEVPPPYRELLAHTSHMTVTVEEFHGDSVDVQVLQTRTDADRYLREILLLTHQSRLVVQYGIVRLNTKFVPAPARNEILAQTKPLGRVLIEHDILRKIELFELVQVECGAKLAEAFSVPTGTRTYGRSAMLYCNNEPAIELLEIVRPA